MKARWLTALITLLAMAAPLAASAATPPMIVEFTAPDGPNTERVVLFVGETACAEVTFEAGSPPTALLGTPTQPPGCHEQGAAITFLEFRADDPPWALFDSVPFASGTTYQFTNWAPQPPGTPLPGYMQTFVDGGSLLRPGPSGNAGLTRDPRSALPEWLFVLSAVAIVLLARRVTAGSPD